MKYTFSPDVLALNPNLKTKRTLTGQASPKASQLEAKFLLLWQCLNGPVLQRETRFHPVRRYRFDFAIVSIKVAIEIEGYGHQKHNRYNGDIEKYNEAARLGWAVHRLTSKMITTDKLQEIIDYVTSRLAMATGGEE